MEVKLLEKKDKENKLSFILKGAKPAYANAIRRIILEEVPVMAIEDVEFKKNSSILYDEIVAHRLGLTPLKTDLKSYVLPEDCKCEGKGCARCQVKLTLKPKDTGIIYATEMKSKDPAIKPVYPKMPIVKLLKGQSLELEATAVLGKGKVHTKWSPGLVYYKRKPVIEITDSKIKDAQKCADICPMKVYEVKDGKLAISKDKAIDCHLCNACVDICPEGIKVEGSDDYIFYIESWGQLSCKDIMLKAMDIFNEKLDEFVEKAKSLD